MPQYVDRQEYIKRLRLFLLRLGSFFLIPKGAVKMRRLLVMHPRPFFLPSTDKARIIFLDEPLFSITRQQLPLYLICHLISSLFLYGNI